MIAKRVPTLDAIKRSHGLLDMVLDTLAACLRKKAPMARNRVQWHRLIADLREAIRELEGER